MGVFEDRTPKPLKLYPKNSTPKNGTPKNSQKWVFLENRTSTE